MAASDDPMGTGGAGRSGAPARDRRRDIRLVATGVVAVLLVWFALANTQKVPIHFWIFSSDARLISVIVISGVLGALIGILGMRRHQSGR